MPARTQLRVGRLTRAHGLKGAIKVELYTDDPARRFTVAHPSGYRGPGFEAGGLFVWGFTALLLGAVLDLSGLAQPWDPKVERPIPESVLSDWMRNRN